MSVFADYTPEEQRLLLHSLQSAAVAIAAASLGRKAETASEGFAAADLITQETEATVSNPLISSVQFALDQHAASGKPFPSFEKAAYASGAQEEAMETLRTVAALLEQKATPEESLGYRQWLMAIARVTAAAGKEGGNFWGRGAVQVNDAEKAALQGVADALGVGVD